LSTRARRAYVPCWRILGRARSRVGRFKSESMWTVRTTALRAGSTTRNTMLLAPTARATGREPIHRERSDADWASFGDDDPIPVGERLPSTNWEAGRLV
jgi:hypothetical protein